MELQKAKHELKVEEWRKLIYECRNSGQTIRAWCNERHISPQTYYRWQHAAWDAGTQNFLEGSKRQPSSFVWIPSRWKFKTGSVQKPWKRSSER